MFKYANQILDFLDEKVKEGVNIPFEYIAPENDRDYGLILKTASGEYIKKYPLNNHNNVIYSFVSYEENKNKLTDDMKKIAESNIGKRLDLYKIAHNYKTSYNDNIYNIQLKDENKSEGIPTPTEFAYNNKLPIDTLENFTKSASEFLKQAHKLSIEDRKKVANEFVKKADDFSINVNTEIRKYASYKSGTLQQIKNAMATRMANYPKEVGQQIRKAIDTIKTAEDVIEFAKLVEKIDNNLNIKKTNHVDPANAFFSIEKDADEINTNKLNRALESGLLNDYLDEPTITALKETGDRAYTDLNESSKNIITTVLKRIN